MTPYNMIVEALDRLRVLDRGGAPDIKDAESVLRTLNLMITSKFTALRAASLITTETKTLTAGQGSYTWGTGGNISTAYPLSIISAYVSDGSSDYELIPFAQTDYDRIVDKTAQGTPGQYYWKPGPTLGTLYFDIVPDKAYVLHVTSQKHLTEITTATYETDDLAVTPECNEAIVANMAKLCLTKFPVEAAQASLILRQAEESMRDIPTVEPGQNQSDYPWLGSNRYNILAGE